MSNKVKSEFFEMTQERRGDNKDWPEWLNRAWNRERGDAGSVWNEIHGTSDEYLVVSTTRGNHSRVLWGDFIVKTGDCIWHCPRALFQLWVTDVGTSCSHKGISLIYG